MPEGTPTRSMDLLAIPTNNERIKNMEKEILCNKVTLGTGKVVLLRDMKIKHQELAAMAAAPKSGESQIMLAMHMQKELVKLLIVQIDGVAVKPSSLEDLDSVFTMSEYGQVLQVVRQLMGDAEMGKFQIELESFGGK